MILTRKLTLAVAGVAAAGVLGTAGVAAATAGPSTPAPAASSAPGTSAPAPADTGKADTGKADKGKADKGRTGRHARGALGRGLHGEWVVKGKDGRYATLVSVRGQVTAVGPASVTVKAEDGFTATFAADADTKVRGADAKTLADVKVGAKGAVVGVKTGNTTTARTVLVRR